MSQGFTKLLNRGVSSSDEPILKRKKAVLNIFNLIGTVIAIPQVIMIYPFDQLSAYAFLSWGIIVLAAYLLHGILSFKTVRDITIFSVIILGSVGAVRMGPESYIHFSSLGIFFAAFIFYDLQKEWSYLLFFTLIEIAVFILTEYSIFQVARESVMEVSKSHKVVVLTGTLLFLIIEIYFFKDVVTRSERAAVKELERMNTEKDILLKEIHHRVKNNLQLLLSLMNLKKRQSDSMTSQELLEDVTNRIRSIAMLHNRVYIQENAESIALNTFVTDLVSDLKSSLSAKLDITLHLRTELEEVDVNNMVPLALIINELVTNSIKHGLADTNNGSIHIVIDKMENRHEYRLTYYDSGRWKENNSNGNDIGLSLISSFSEQLDGYFELVDSTDSTKKSSIVYFKLVDES